MALDNDFDCDTVDVFSKTTFYNVAALSTLTYRRGHYGGWKGRIVTPSERQSLRGGIINISNNQN
jgi:hypothetical protein